MQRNMSGNLGLYQACRGDEISYPYPYPYLRNFAWISMDIHECLKAISMDIHGYLYELTIKLF